MFADGDHKLVAAHYSTNKSELKLKVYKGASLVKESNLVDTPTALISLYMDNLQPRVPGKWIHSIRLNAEPAFALSTELFIKPAIAVASGSSIFVYKNLRPGFQFTLPALEVSGVEKDIWAKAKEV